MINVNELPNHVFDTSEYIVTPARPCSKCEQLQKDNEVLRDAIVNEIADKYHGELASFFAQKGRHEVMDGIAEKDFERAREHEQHRSTIKRMFIEQTQPSEACDE
tara:strand:- start:113 stop:427 length:315 start_codon:yes stop_codon:yes gene_type:complete